MRDFFLMIICFQILVAGCHVVVFPDSAFIIFLFFIFTVDR